MPKGKPNLQTMASEKYHRKAGYIVKGFKVKEEVVKEFTICCKQAGISQAAWLTEKMKKFIEEQNMS